MLLVASHDGPRCFPQHFSVIYVVFGGDFTDIIFQLK